MYRLISALGLFVGIVLLVLIVLFILRGKRKKNNYKANINSEIISNVEDGDYSSNDEIYEKTVPLSSMQNRVEIACTEENKQNIVFEEVPRLSDIQKTELLGSLNVKKASTIKNTEVLTSKQKSKPFAILRFKEKNIEYEMYSQFINIGRNPDLCDVVIDDDTYMGKHHAMIYTRENKFFILDVSSKNGTYLNDEKVEGSREIDGNCVIKLANTLIEFVID